MDQKWETKKLIYHHHHHPPTAQNFLVRAF
jgi:hypothetical protein